MKDYVTPLTDVTDIELESGFCASAAGKEITETEGDRHVEIEDQPGGGTIDLGDQGWD